MIGGATSYKDATIMVMEATLAVHFTQLTAKPDDKGVKVSSMVSNEQNVVFYTLESSVDCQGTAVVRLTAGNDVYYNKAILQ